VRSEISLSKLSGYLWDAANILRGPVDVADFKTYIFPLLCFKRISAVYDEVRKAALDELTLERAQSFLTDEHIQRIVSSYNSFEDQKGLCAVTTNDDIRSKDSNLSMHLYVQDRSPRAIRKGSDAEYRQPSLREAIHDWQTNSIKLRETMRELLETIQQGDVR